MTRRPCHHRRSLALLVLGLVLSAGACSGTSRVSDLELAPSVARVSGIACNRTVEGSAVLVSDGLFLTNAHVIAGAESELRVRVPGAADVSATVVGFDADRDLAVLATPGVAGRALSVGTTDAGDRGVIAAVTTDLEVELIDYEVLRRIIATGDDIYGEGDVERSAVEVAANVSPGVSGAALVNRDGELVGVVFAESRTRESTYAVYATEITAFMAEVDPSTQVAPGRCR